MVSNLILSEIESFNKMYLEIVDELFDPDHIKLMTSLLISPDTGEFFLQMNIDHMKKLKQMSMSEDFRKYRHLTLSEKVLLCPLKEKDKLFEDDFEFVLAVYSDGALSGLIYTAVDKKHQEAVISKLMNKPLILLLQNTVALLGGKYAAYNGLFYTVNSYLEILSVKDKNMPFHTTNVANLCLKMAKKAKLSVLDSVKLYIAALLHDSGKLYVPDDILNSKKKYSYHEFEMIKSHPEKGAEMAKADLNNLPLLKDVPEIIRSHHEKIDGTGYPDGLKGKEIPYLSRFLVIADAVDAMLTHRFYKKQMTRNHVIKELNACAGTQFDENLVHYMVAVLKESRNKYDIESVVGTNYIHNVALMYYYENINQIITVSGSMVMQKNKGKFMLNDSFDHDTKKMEGAKICFYYLNDIYEYNINVHRSFDDQLIIDSFRFEPLEEQFAIPWQLKASIYYNKGKRWDANVIKIGGSSLIFEVPTKDQVAILEKKKEVMTVPVHLKVEEFNEFIEIEVKLMQYFEFGDKTVIFAKYLGIKDNKKERLIRGLFKKQILERKVL